MSSPDTVLAGFADPIAEAQCGFRAVLQAMSSPGMVCPLAGPQERPEGMGAAAASLLLSLIDHATPVWLAPSMSSNSGVADYLRFHTGAPLADAPDRASFAYIGQAEKFVDYGAFSIGTPEYPDKSTTLVIEVDGFEVASGQKLVGPGIQTEAVFDFDPASQGIWSAVRANADLFPLGLDFILCAPEAIAAIPRSTRLGE